MTTENNENNSQGEPNNEMKTPPANGGTPPPANEATPPAAPEKKPTLEDSSSTDLGGEETSKNDETDLGGEEENKEGARPYDEYIGPPEGEYEDFTLPDGAAPDDALRSEFSEQAKALGLNQKGAQRLVDLYAKTQQQQVERWGNHVKELKEQAQKHPVIGGAKYQAAVSAGRQVIAKFGTPGLRDVMNKYGVGAHPEMILFMANIAKATGETPTLDNGGGTGVTQKPLHELMYKD